MMTRKLSIVFSLFLAIGILAPVGIAQTTGFIYQGSLNSGGVVANGNHDFEFALFDALSGGAQLGSTSLQNGIAVTNGIFAVSLDFGSQFPGAQRFLEIRVRPTGGGAFTLLAPRQPVTSTPYAIKSLTTDNATQLGGVAANQYLQTDGNGSGLSNLNAASITSGTLSNARLGLIPTANIADNAVTAAKIAGGQVVKGVTVGATTLTDNVTLAGSGTITVTPTGGNTVTIASTGGGVGGSGTANTVPLWSDGMTLGNSVITQSAAGNVGIGTSNPSFGRLTVVNSLGTGVFGTGGSFGMEGLSSSPGGIGVYGRGTIGVEGFSSSDFGGTGVHGRSGAVQGSIALRATGTSWFTGDTTPLSIGSAGSGTGIAIGSGGAVGYIFAFDYGFGQPRALALNGPGGNVGIGTSSPQRTLHVNGRVRINLAPVEPSVVGVCFTNQGDVVQCGGSSLRWKTNVQLFSDGMNILRQLRPISYNLKEGGAYDIGLGAEDVAKVAPFFALRNKEGVVEGVRYERLNMVLINAVNQQQEQIERQQQQIDALKGLVCASNREAAICKELR